MQPKVSVVIPTYNSHAILPYCLRSLFNQTASPDTYELVVIDDGSTDPTPEVVRQLSPPVCPTRTFRTVPSTQYRSFSR